jgi:pimeloyl-ACP methyl ester carboxylesterase
MIHQANQVHWSRWQDFRSAQHTLKLPAGSVAHVPLQLRYIDTGADTQGTVLLLHGIPTWGFLFHQSIPALVAEGYRVIVPDFQGFGWSDRRDCFDRSFQDQARLIVSLLTHLAIPRANLVGHDTGGAVALILAIEQPHLVDRLVLCNNVCYDRFDDDMLDFGHPLRWRHRPIADLINILDESLAAGLSNPEQLTPAFRDGIIAPWNSEEGKLSLLRNAAALNANQTMALVDRHSTITAPTLVLWGLDDPWQQSEDGRRLAGEIPQARFQGVPGASHWLPQDAPAIFNAALSEFFLEENNVSARI